jgi:hypothetical protein
MPREERSWSGLRRPGVRRALVTKHSDLSKCA